MDDLIKRTEAISIVHSAIEAEIPFAIVSDLIKGLPSAEAVSQSDQYKKGFEDAKRAFLIEYARESENMRKRNAQLEVMLNAQKAISAEAVQGGRYENAMQKLREMPRCLNGVKAKQIKKISVDEVVRCKDCCHRVHDEDRGLYYCEMYYGQGDVSDENFCQWGERREPDECE